jgi:WD40 repeat protein
VAWVPLQELHSHEGVVWTMKFSRNGKYLASAGQDGVVRVWEVIPNRGAEVRRRSPHVSVLFFWCQPLARFAESRTDRLTDRQPDRYDCSGT